MTEARDRRVEIAWSDPLPSDETRRLSDALLKAQLGVPLETLRRELGYAATAREALESTAGAAPIALAPDA